MNKDTSKARDTGPHKRLVARTLAGLLALAGFSVALVAPAQATVQISTVPVVEAAPVTIVVAPAPLTTIPASLASAAQTSVVKALATVTVVRGDTLSEIAERRCGSQSYWRAIWGQNPTIRNPNLIYPGQKLNVSCVRTNERASRSTASTRVTTQATAVSGNIQTVLDFARAQVGKRYGWAQDGPNSFDCSGLVMAAYRRIGVNLPHQSGAMLRYGTPVSRANLRPGDVVWPRTQYGTKGHVSIYLGDNMVVEASSSKRGVVIRKMWGFWTARRMV